MCMYNFIGKEGKGNTLAIVPATCFEDPKNPLASPISSGSQKRGHMMIVMSSRYPTAKPATAVNYTIPLVSIIPYNPI